MKGYLKIEMKTAKAMWRATKWLVRQMGELWSFAIYGHPADPADQTIVTALSILCLLFGAMIIGTCVFLVTKGGALFFVMIAGAIVLGVLMMKALNRVLP